MKTIEKVALGLVLVIALCLIFGSIIANNEKSVYVPIENKSEIAIDVKSNFIEGCVEDGDASYTLCVCAYNSLRSQLGDEGIIDLSLDYLKTEQIPEKVVEKMIKDCIK